MTDPDWWLQQMGQKLCTSSSFYHVSIAQRTPDTNVVLLLSHLGGNAHADLVEPLVTAAVTLDPIHLPADTHKQFSAAGI